MEKKKSYGVLIVGAILLILGIVLTVITHNNSYQESVAYGSQLSDVKAQLEEVEASIEAVTGGTADGDLDSLNAQKDELTLRSPLCPMRSFPQNVLILTAWCLYSSLFC